MTGRVVAYDAGGGEIVMQEEALDFDAGSNIIQRTLKERFHNATGTGPLQGPTGSEPRARISLEAIYPDPIGRTQAQVNYGTNGGSSFSRSSTIPTRSDERLINSFEYDDTGENDKATDPADSETRREFDDAGRQTKLIENYVSGGTNPDQNRTTETTYTLDGKVSTLTAKNSVTGDQVTTWLYGTTLTDSEVASNLLLRAKRGALGSSTDQMEYGYNRLGQVKDLRDENGNIRLLEYDKLGRPEHDRVTSLGSGVDGTVRRISRAYEVRGMISQLTSYDNSTVGSGTVVNEVTYEYDDFVQLKKEFQSHEGAVGGSSPKVEYGYADGSANTIRRTSMTGPDQTKVNYDYGLSDQPDNNLSRVSYLHCGTSIGVNYHYLGVERSVICNYSCEPAVELTYYTPSGNGDAGDQYTGLDRFGRVIDQRWRKTSDDSDRVRVKYGFNRASNRVWKEDTVAPTEHPHDEYYTYDGLNSLKTMDRGILNGTKTGITGDPTWEEAFNYDPLGNWNGSTYCYDVTDDGYHDLSQNRTHTKENEIATITETVGTAWPDPTHDSNGNLLSIPKPNDLGNSFALTWDAWNRLVEVQEGTVFVARYAYDGADRRVTKLTGPELRHYYYSDQWQVIEERLTTNDCADCRYTWGIRYQDDLVCRDRGTERFYALHDYFSVVAIIDVDGFVAERYDYEAFGATQYMDEDFVPTTGSDSDWEVLFHAHRNDSETGLYQIRYRYLHPNLGRWISRDPIGEEGGINLYGFLANDPVNRNDSLGLNWELNLPFYKPDFRRIEGMPFALGRSFCSWWAPRQRRDPIRDTYDDTSWYTRNRPRSVAFAENYFREFIAKQAERVCRGEPLREIADLTIAPQYNGPVGRSEGELGDPLQDYDQARFWIGYYTFRLGRFELIKQDGNKLRYFARIDIIDIHGSQEKYAGKWQPLFQFLVGPEREVNCGNWIVYGAIDCPLQ